MSHCNYRILQDYLDRVSNCETGVHLIADENGYKRRECSVYIDDIPL